MTAPLLSAPFLPGALLLTLSSASPTGALVMGCSSSARSGTVRPGDSIAARAAGVHEVRYRPVFDTPEGDAQVLVDAVPGGHWDEGLTAAATELLGLHVDLASRIDAPTASLVTARAGYPGQARYVRALNGGAFPEALVTEVAKAAAWNGPVDLGMAVRRYDDGTALWVIGWARHLADVDPILRDLPLDEAQPIRIGIVDPDLQDAELRLFLAPPFGPVEEMSLTDGLARWVDRFHTPGEWRVEAIATQDNQSKVALLFSLWVDEEPPTPRPLAGMPTQADNPIVAEQDLFAQLNVLRLEHGLPPVEWFALFEPLVREHSAFMASAGTAAHILPGLTPGVSQRARGYAFPLAFHHQSVATAPTAEEALALVLDSPAHKKTLLCEACTHATIGVALEPVLNRVPRVFVTWELMEFPKGDPRLLNYDRR